MKSKCKYIQMNQGKQSISTSKNAIDNLNQAYTELNPLFTSIMR